MARPRQSQSPEHDPGRPRNRRAPARQRQSPAPPGAAAADIPRARSCAHQTPHCAQDRSAYRGFPGAAGVCHLVPANRRAACHVLHRNSCWPAYGCRDGRQSTVVPGGCRDDARHRSRCQSPPNDLPPAPAENPPHPVWSPQHLPACGTRWQCAVWAMPPAAQTRFHPSAHAPARSSPARHVSDERLAAPQRNLDPVPRHHWPHRSPEIAVLPTCCAPFAFNLPCG